MQKSPKTFSMFSGISEFVIVCILISDNCTGNQKDDAGTPCQK